ncbi:MAG TPA: SDR family oxidoreductase [Lactovum miscens]|uniref:SDR family oxidoreductase n=1 Tax=Lactovum miscens TaxID=190387 RepID=UPI002EDB8822
MSNWLGIEGKNYIVTGGSSGIGESIVKSLLNQGAKVANFDIHESNETHQNMLFVKTNITDRENVKKSISIVEKTFGTVDGLVNNAGINIPSLLVDIQDPEGQYELNVNSFDKMLAINVKGTFFMSQEVSRILAKNKSGVIVNMSSESGLEGSEGQSIYAATKGAINSLTRSWAKEMAKFGVRVVGIAPGIMETTGLRTVAYETALAYTRGKTVEQLRASYGNTSTIPLGRSGRLSEVADLVCYYLSERSSYITGVTTNVAGGKTRG